MKFIRKLVLQACAMSFAIGASGAQVDSTAAAFAVKGWLQQDRTPLGERMGSEVRNVETFRDKVGGPLYHVVNLKPSGFVIMPADDQLEPVIAFVEKGQFDPSPSNPLGALVSRDIPARMALVRAQGPGAASPALRASYNKWQKLLQIGAGGVQPAGIVSGEISDLRVAPFIQTLWDQGPLSTVVSNNILVNDTVSVTTYFTTNLLGDTSSSSVSITNSTGVFLITPGWPANHSFVGASASVSVTSGPDGTVTNFISVTVAIQIVVTNQFGDILTPPNTILRGSGTFTDVATGSPGGSVTHVIPVSIEMSLVVSDEKACYNYFTPPHGGEENPRLFPPGRGNIDNYPCGCVATAMAQLMYYFQYPSTGVGTTCFTVTVDGNPYAKNMLGGDYNGGPYQWANMPLAPDYYSLTITQAQAVGALTYDAGLAVDMQYTAASSGSYLTDAKTALVNTFKYNNAIVNFVTNLNTGCFECNLNNMINPNLDARLPVLLGITGDPGGHCVVVDGYGYSMGELYHHLNMGWSGDYNAWYSLPIIDMYDFYGNNQYAYFWDVTECIYNVFTNSSGEIISGRVLDATGTPITGASVTASRDGGGVYTAVTDAKGIYALVGVPSSSVYTITVTNAFYALASSKVSTSISLDLGASSGNIWGANFTLAPAAGPPVITLQPASQFVTLGSTATFTTAATGQLPLAYQWQYQPIGSPAWINSSDGGSFGGSGTVTLTVIQPPATNTGEQFQCIITNAFGSVTSSPPAVLTVNVSPYLNITTLAGIAGASGITNGSNGTTVFNDPVGVAVDAGTNVYIADLHNHVIRKLALAGTNWVSSTIAGQAGNPGSADGSGTNAQFNGPYGVAVDGAGNVYVADTGNSTIRILTPSGGSWAVTTIAGLAGSTGYTDGNNSTARFRYPTGLAVDGGGNIFVADDGNCIVRKITPSGGNWAVNAIAGLAGAAANADGNNSNARFHDPYGIAVDVGGNVYVADKYTCTIRKLVPSGGNWMVSTIAGQAYKSGGADGISTNALFNGPTGIAADPGGNLYVADEGNNTIRRLSAAGTNWIVFTVAGLARNSGTNDGFGSAVRFNGPYGIAVDGNTNVYVADSVNNTIRGTPLSNPPPAPAVVKLVKQKASGSAMTLTWSAMAGHTYQVQFKTNINQAVWVSLPAVTMTNSVGDISVPIGTDPQRYYRVVLLQ